MLGQPPADVRAKAARPRRLLAAAVALASSVMLMTRPAHADETTDYCRKVRAQAESEASLLMAPSVTAAVIRYPATGVADTTGVQVGTGVQPRASLSYGLVDMYRGLGVLDAATADCKRQAAAAELQELLVSRADLGRLPALESELAFLTQKKPEVDALVQDAEARFAAHTTTLVEVHELRQGALAIDRKTREVAREVAVLRRRGFKMPNRPISELLSAYDERAISYEHAVSHVRKVQAWKLDVSGGVATSPVVDYFAVASLSYNLGGLFQGSAERREVLARSSEIKNARYELRHQVESLLDEVLVDVESSRAELRAFDDELARIAKERASLDALDAPNKSSVLAQMTLEAVSLGADRAYLSAYVSALSAFGGRP